jgi:uncharacterized protein (TIGR02145 family)
MKRIFIITALLCFMLIVSGQTINLSFTAVENVSYIQLDSIKVMNRTQGGDTVLYWPDTVLSSTYIGLYEKPSNENAFRVIQNYPNPVVDRTTVSLYVPEKDKVSIILTDILGRVIVKSERVLDKGKHAFHFIPGSCEFYYLSAIWQGNASSIKMVCMPGYSPGGTARLDYSGGEPSAVELKSTTATPDFVFNPGDELLYIGYIDTLESGILDAPEESGDYTFQFAYNTPCPGMPTVEYEGQVYNTVQILSQCWLKENLNVGTMISGWDAMTDNGFIEKYCYNNEPDSCTKYGGLYQWWEMMQYTTQQGARGICPPGWHLPTDEEWKLLEGMVDSQYGIENNTWDDYGQRGYDAGKNLKTISGWSGNSNGTDLFGFSALPCGYHDGFGYCNNVGYRGYWWLSTELNESDAWSRYLNSYSQGLDRYSNHKGYGFSVRCLRDY